MDKLIDEILAIYKRIDKGEICEEDEARKELKKLLDKFKEDISENAWNEAWNDYNEWRDE